MTSILIFTVLYGLFPLIVYLFLRKKIIIEAKLLLPYIVFTFVSSVYEFVFTYLFQFNIKYWFITYSLLAFIVIGIFFYKILKGKYRLLFHTSYTIFLGLMLFVMLNWEYYEVIELSSFLDVYQTIFILLFSIFWFKKVFIELKHDNLLDSPIFYFISGLILYYCGTIILFLMSNDIYQDNNNILQYYLLLNVVLNLVLRTLLIVAIWKARVK